MREQWLRRLLKNPLLDRAAIMEPFARRELAEAGRHGQTILLSLDQTDLGERMALLMLSLRVGGRALPLAWRAEAGAANIGFGGQRIRDTATKGRPGFWRKVLRSAASRRCACSRRVS